MQCVGWFLRYDIINKYVISMQDNINVSCTMTYKKSRHTRLSSWFFFVSLEYSSKLEEVQVNYSMAISTLLSI